MVPRCLLLPVLALTALACRRAAERSGTTAGTPPLADSAARLVQERYTSRDMVAAGAWTWTSPLDIAFVLIDAQSTIEGVVQARADLWIVTDSGAASVGRSDVMASAAQIGAFAFEDLTGDGLPDLFGYVADSAGVAYPVFIPGAHGAMREEIAIAAAGWHFETAEDHLPQVVRGGARSCALQLWAELNPPDGRDAGWRYLAVLQDGHLGPPTAEAPSCP